MGNTTVTITETTYEYDERGRVSKETVTVTETEPTNPNGSDKKSDTPPYVPWVQGGGQITRPGGQPFVTWNDNPFGLGVMPCSDTYLTTVEKAEQRTDEEDGVVRRFPGRVKISERDLVGREGVEIYGMYL